MSQNEFNDHFGSVIKPDTVRITSVMKVSRKEVKQQQP